MKLKKRIAIAITAILMALGTIGSIFQVSQNPAKPIITQAAVYRNKIWTSTKPKVIIGNKRSHIYHVYRQRRYRMNSSNAVYFKSEAAARAAGYRLSKR